jgi:hypothetical protein
MEFHLFLGDLPKGKDTRLDAGVEVHVFPLESFLPGSSCRNWTDFFINVLKFLEATDMVDSTVISQVDLIRLYLLIGKAIKELPDNPLSDSRETAAASLTRLLERACQENHVDDAVTAKILQPLQHQSVTGTMRPSREIQRTSDDEKFISSFDEKGYELDEKGEAASSDSLQRRPKRNRNRGTSSPRRPAGKGLTRRPRPHQQTFQY